MSVIWWTAGDLVVTNPAPTDRPHLAKVFSTLTWTVPWSPAGRPFPPRALEVFDGLLDPPNPFRLVLRDARHAHKISWVALPDSPRWVRTTTSSGSTSPPST